MVCCYHYFHNHFYAQKDTRMETASPPTDINRLPSPRRNCQPSSTTSTTVTTSTIASPSLHTPSSTSVSSPSASQQFRELHHRRRRSLNSISPSTAAKHAEHTATCNASAVVAAAAASSSYASPACSPDSASLTPLDLLTTVSSPPSDFPSSFFGGELALRPFPPEAVAALLILAHQIQLASRSSPTSLKSRNALPPSAFGGKSKLHVLPVLLLDVRTFVHHSKSRIRSAVNFCIPNRLLKRSSFTIAKIHDTLLSKRARSLLKNWSSYANIIIYDANSLTVNDTSIISHVSKKFRQENCTAELGWLYGGFDNFSRTYTELCEPSSPLCDPNSSKYLRSSFLSNLSCEDLSSQTPSLTTEDGIAEEQPRQPLKRKLPLRISTNGLDVSTGPLTCPTSSIYSSELGSDSSDLFAESLRREDVRGIALRPQTARVAEKSLEVTAIGETVAIRLPPCVTEDGEESEECSAAEKACPANRTESWDRASNQRLRSEKGGRYLRRPKCAADTPESPVSNYSSKVEAQLNAHHVPQFLKELTIGRDAEQKLAKIFQTIEKKEQRRLKSLMLHHARYPSTKHPFNISAGVERGEKNRYVNIWPYDYTRVRLSKNTPPADGIREGGDDSDYINASFIKAPHCDQTYVATQGPMPTTFDDFWNIVWYKGIKVIVMLTREVEGGRVKCHRYWPNENGAPLNYGPALTVELLDKEVLPEGDGSIIRRHFRMRRVPTGATRIIVQLQYVGWPDFGVPDTPLAVLHLRAAVLAGPLIHEESIGDKPPTPQDRPRTILVHCSAGCGRTGAFCTIDSTLRLLEKPDGPFGCANEAAIASDITLAKHEAEIESRNEEEAEREEAKQPLSLSAFPGGTFSVAAALRSEPTPDTFRLKMPKFLKGNRRIGAAEQAKGSQAENHGPAEKSKRDTTARPPSAPSGDRNAFTSTTCAASECKSPFQQTNDKSHPPFALAEQVDYNLGKSVQFKTPPLPYPNLFPSAESRCTRDIVRGCVEVFREQRLSMVQTLRQLVFCYEAVLWQLMGAINPAAQTTEVERGRVGAFCGRPPEGRKQPANPPGSQMASMMAAEHTASIRLEKTPIADVRVDPYKLTTIKKRKRNERLEHKTTCSSRCSSSYTPASSVVHEVEGILVNEATLVSPPFPTSPCGPSMSPALAHKNRLPDCRLSSITPKQDDVPSAKIPEPGDELCMAKDKGFVKLDAIGGSDSMFSMPAIPASGDVAVRRMNTKDLALLSSIRTHTNRGVGAAPSERRAFPQEKTDGESAGCFFAINEAMSDTSASPVSVNPDIYSTDPSSGKPYRSQDTSPGLATEVGPVRTLTMERGTFFFGSPLSPLGSANGGHLRGEARESASQDKNENATPSVRTRCESIKRKEAEDYFSVQVQTTVSPPRHVGVFVPRDDTAKHHARLATVPSIPAQPFPRTTIGASTLAIQSLTSPSPTAVSTALSLMKDVYGRRRSDPSAMGGTISLLQMTHDDPTAAAHSAFSQSSGQPRFGHPSEFERILRDTTAKTFSMWSSASGLVNQDLHHTRSAAAGGAGFGPVGTSHTSLSH